MTPDAPGGGAARERPTLQPLYRRSDPRGRFPFRLAVTELAGNRLAVFWRPLVDMTDSELAPLRLRMIRPVAAWLADPDPDRRSWFSMLGVPGLRHQVVRHAGLPAYECRDPTGLPPGLRTPPWRTLVERIDQFQELDDAARALVVFQLAQLSYCQFALELAGAVERDGDPLRDHYAYEVARVHARTPGHVVRALSMFEALARSSPDRRLALAACFQGIGHALRGNVGIPAAQRFARRGCSIAAGSMLEDQWHTSLVLSRFRRALALLRLAEGRIAEARVEAAAALGRHDEISGCANGEADALIVAENRIYLAELELSIALRDSPADVRPLCATLLRLDPYCVETRLRVGDALAAVGDYAEAASWYELAGELGTGAGALGWFRAGQCHDLTGARGRAANAMGRCLELDETAIEPRRYLEGASLA